MNGLMHVFLIRRVLCERKRVLKANQYPWQLLKRDSGQPAADLVHGRSLPIFKVADDGRHERLALPQPQHKHVFPCRALMERTNSLKESLPFKVINFRIVQSGSDTRNFQWKRSWAARRYTIQHIATCVDRRVRTFRPFGPAADQRHHPVEPSTKDRQRQPCLQICKELSRDKRGVCLGTVWAAY